MDREVIYALRTRGVDVTTAYEQGMVDQYDWEHLDYATAQGRVVYTYSVGEQMRRLLKIIAAKPAETMENHVEFLSAWG